MNPPSPLAQQIVRNLQGLPLPEAIEAVNEAVAVLQAIKADLDARYIVPAI